MQRDPPCCPSDLPRGYRGVVSSEKPDSQSAWHGGSVGSAWKSSSSPLAVILGVSSRWYSPTGRTERWGISSIARHPSYSLAVSLLGGQREVGQRRGGAGEIWGLDDCRVLVGATRERPLVMTALIPWESGSTDGETFVVVVVLG